MKRKKEDLFMFLIVIPFALLGAIILYVGARDVESRRRQDQAALHPVVPRQDYRTVQPHLETLEDSIHEFEDGF